MKNFVKSTKTWMFALLCVLFFSIGIKAEAAPGTVSNVKQTNDTVNTVTIEWTAATVGSPTLYEVNAYDNSSCTGTPITTTSPYTKAIIENLSAGKSYYVQVVAIDKDKTKGTPSKAVEVVTSPNAKVTKLKQGKLAAKKISLSWAAVNGANCYDVGYRKDGSKADPKFKETTKTSFSISGAADTAYQVYVYPMRKNSAGTYVASGNNDTAAAAYMYTTPKQVTKLALYSTGYFSATGYSDNRLSKIATFSGKLSKAADGYQYELRGYNGKKITTKTVNLKSVSSSNKLVQFTKGIRTGEFMKIRIRPYVTLNGKKTYLKKWSNYTWFAMTPKTVKAEITPSQRVEDGLNISWSKIKGAKDYSVYVSRTKDGKYTKVTTTPNTTYNFRTFNGSQLTGGTYYYYIVANKKVGGKTYKSDDSWVFSKSIRITYY